MTTALYRRYRPDAFADVIGQEHVTEPLMQALADDRVSHAYLFSGPRGCGKTTSARILARCLNCASGPTPQPCGTCESCRDLATGGTGSLDVVEIDAASHNGVDDARDLRERAFFAPTRDRFKIYILDEAHMVTTQGFNALLKLVEEPPEHIKFIFATTEPEKVISTIRSRTHHYPFRLVSPHTLGAYIEKLAQTEGVSLDSGVVPLVVRAGGGSVRDTLSVLDQLIAGAGGEVVGYAQAVALLGYTHATLLDETITGLAAGDGQALFGVVDRVIASGHEPRRFVEDLLERLRDLIVFAATGDQAEKLLRGLPADQLARMRQQADQLALAGASRLADIVNTALTEMVGATAPRLHLELLVARMLLAGVRTDPADFLPVGEQAAASGVHGSRAGGKGAGQGAGKDEAAQGGAGQEAAGQGRAVPERARQEGAKAARPAQAGSQGATEEASQLRPKPADLEPGLQPRSQEGTSARNAGAVSDGSQITKQASSERGQRGAPRPAVVADEVTQGPEQVSPAAVTSLPLDLDSVHKTWPKVMEALSERYKATWSLIHHNAQVVRVEGDTIVLGFEHEGIKTRYIRADYRDRMEQVASLVLGRTVKVGAVVGTEAQSLPTHATEAAGPTSAIEARPTPGEEVTAGHGKEKDEERPTSIPTQMAITSIPASSRQARASSSGTKPNTPMMSADAEDRPLPPVTWDGSPAVPALSTAAHSPAATAAKHDTQQEGSAAGEDTPGSGSPGSGSPRTIATGSDDRGSDAAGDKPSRVQPTAHATSSPSSARAAVGTSGLASSHRATTSPGLVHNDQDLEFDELDETDSRPALMGIELLQSELGAVKIDETDGTKG